MTMIKRFVFVRVLQSSSRESSFHFGQKTILHQMKYVLNCYDYRVFPKGCLPKKAITFNIGLGPIFPHF